MFENTLTDTLRRLASALEKETNTDVMFYFGPISSPFFKDFRNFVEKLASSADKKEALSICLHTGGGHVEPVEQMATVLRQHYKYVNFIVPELAMSAGTIFCMSGDRIYMDYSSALGPIDPQITVEGEFVPALGYLDQYERLIKKAEDGKLTVAEFEILRSQDLARLRRFEQARDLSVELLKKFLVDHKFASWDKHRTDPKKLGKAVTQVEKEERAITIAQQLGDNKRWHSHARRIGIKTLRDELKIEIEDYSNEKNLLNAIRAYSDLVIEYAMRMNQAPFLHSRLT